MGDEENKIITDININFELVLGIISWIKIYNDRFQTSLPATTIPQTILLQSY